MITRYQIANASLPRHLLSAIEPILFLLRQDGTEKQGWRGTPFYWPVIRAQTMTPTAIYTAETIG